MNAFIRWSIASCIVSACAAADPCGDTPLSGSYDIELEQLSSACLSQPPLPMPSRIEVTEHGTLMTQIFDRIRAELEQDRCSASVEIEKVNTNSGAHIMITGARLAREDRELSGEVAIAFAMIDTSTLVTAATSPTAARTPLCEGTAHLTLRPTPEKQFRGLGEVSALRRLPKVGHSLGYTF